MADHTKTIAVIGRFRANGDASDSAIFRFESGANGADGNLGAPEVFGTLKPELRLVAREPVTIGNHSYPLMELAAPEEDSNNLKDNLSLAIGLNNLLLEQTGGEDKDDQTIGGVLMAKLLGDLDVVTRFAGPRLPKALLEVARQYLNVRVNEILPDELRVAGEINAMLRDSPLAADALLRVLMCFTVDRPYAEMGLLAAMDDRDLRGPVKDAIKEAVLDLREKVLLRSREDDAWRNILGINPVNPRTKEEMAWVADMSKSPDLRLDLGRMDNINFGASLRQLYQRYMRHSENLHKFVRSPMLHSYVFMWLMSKYANFSGGTHGQAANEAYRRGVKGAGEKRLYGESDADMRARRKLAREAAKGAREGIAEDERFRDADEKSRERMKKAVDVAENVSLDIFQINLTFTRAELQEFLEELFEDAAAATSGPLRDVLDRSRERAAAYKGVYQKLLGILNGDSPLEKTKVLSGIADCGAATMETRAALSTAAEEAFGKEKDRVPALEDTAAIGEYNRTIRDAVLNNFATSWGATSIRQFLDDYAPAQEAIDDQATRLRNRYRAQAGLAGRLGEVSKSAATDSMPHAAAIAANVRPEAKEKLRAAAMSASRGVPRATSFSPGETVLGKMKDAGLEAFNADIVSGEEKVATVSVTDKGQTDIVYELDIPEDLEKITLNAPKEMKISLDDLDPDGATRTHASRLQGDDERVGLIVEAVDELSDYANLREDLRQLYCGATGTDMDEKALKAFRRTLRALTLGEYIASAPETETRLGEQDVSSTLRLMIDVANQIGDPDNTALAQPAPDKGSAEALGPMNEGDPAAALNLSYYFRVPDDADIGTTAIQEAMRYHRSLCETVGKVRDHMMDLRDLAGIAATLPNDCRLVVVNRNLKEYLSEAPLRKAPFLPVSDRPSVLYLMRGAKARQADWNGFNGMLAAQFQNPDVKLHCPMIIAAEADAALDSTPFPVADLGTLREMGFRATPANQPKLGPTDQPAPEHIFSNVDEIVVDNDGALMSVGAAMAVVPFINSGSGPLGNVSGDPALLPFLEDFKEKTGLDFREGESVAGLLHRMWTESSMNSCLETFLLARLASAAANRADPATKISLHNLLCELDLVEPGGTEPDIVLNAQDALLKSRVIGGDGPRRVLFFIQQPNRPAFNIDNQNHLSDSQSYFFRIEGVAKTRDPQIGSLDHAERSRLAWLNI